MIEVNSLPHRPGKVAAFRRWLKKPVDLRFFKIFVAISAILWLTSFIYWLLTGDAFAAMTYKVDLIPEAFGLRQFPTWEYHFLGAGLAMSARANVGKFASSTLHLTIPYAMLFVFFSILPLEFARRWFNASQCRKFKICPNCEYDLRASTDRCPECGTRIT